MAYNCNRLSPPVWSMFTQRARLNRKKKSRKGGGLSDQSQFRDRGLSRVLLRASVDDTPHHAEMHSSPCSDFRCRSRDKRCTRRVRSARFKLQRTDDPTCPRARGKCRNNQKMRKISKRYWSRVSGRRAEMRKEEGKGFWHEVSEGSGGVPRTPERWTRTSRGWCRGDGVQRRGANPEAAAEQRERARRTDGSQRPTESLAGEPKGRRQAASQPAGGGGGEFTTQPPAGLNPRRFFLQTRWLWYPTAPDNFPKCNVDGNNSRGHLAKLFQVVYAPVSSRDGPHAIPRITRLKRSSMILITHRRL